jgi:hypothetical protein
LTRRSHRVIEMRPTKAPFDAAFKLTQLNAVFSRQPRGTDAFAYLRAASADALVTRLGDDVVRDLPHVADVGCVDADFARAVRRAGFESSFKGVQRLTQVALTEELGALRWGRDERERD